MFEFGKINLQAILLVVLSFGVIWTDLRFRKIFNAWTVGFALCGFLAAVIDFQWQGAGLSLLGFLFGGASLVWLYRSGHLGAGDLKYLMAVGAIGGPSQVILTLMLGFPIGGIWALGQLSKERRLVQVLLNWWQFIVARLSGNHAAIPPEMNQKSRIPFGAALSFGTLLSLGWDPFREIWPWFDSWIEKSWTRRI